jgi:lysophospholipase L1-like esterase
VLSSAVLRLRELSLLVLLPGLAACGGGSPGTPTPIETHTVVGVVFYDQNANGQLDSGEGARVPDVEVVLGGRSGRSEKLTGRVSIAGVPAGSLPVSVRAESLPPFYAPGAMPTATVPQAPGADVLVPITLPIGSNVAHRYMAFGDSITVGTGAQSSDGYRDLLQDQLRSHFGAGSVIDEGIEATRTPVGYARIGFALDQDRPAYTLILYGTNDWNRGECKTEFPCDVVQNLQGMIREAKGRQSLPVLGTIPPVNPDRDEFGRNDWVTQMNLLVRPMARQEGAVVADIQAAFLREGNLASLFADHIHPNDRGYQVLAAEFFRALTQPASAAPRSSSLPSLFRLALPPRG